MFNRHDIARDAFQLTGPQAKRGYDWWWHSLTGRHAQTGRERTFFIEFFLCNPASGGQAPVFGQLPENQAGHVPPSYLMVKAGSWGRDAAQLHRFFGWDAVSVKRGTPYSVSAGDCLASETELRGSVSISPEEAAEHPEWMCGSGEMRWDLKIDKQIAYNVGYGASLPFRILQLFEMFWHAEGMKTAYSGEIWWNGERYLVEPETCWGYADKNWGKDFTSPWVWLSSCRLSSDRTGDRLENSVFDVGGGCPKIGPLALPRQLLSAFWYEGQCFEFNFSKFWTFPRTTFSFQETEDRVRWRVVQRTWRNRVVVDLECDKAEMLFINYEAPDGRKRHNRLWNGGTGRGRVRLYRDEMIIDRIRVESAGCEYGEYDPEDEETAEPAEQERGAGA